MGSSDSYTSAGDSSESLEENEEKFGSRPSLFHSSSLPSRKQPPPSPSHSSPSSSAAESSEKSSVPSDTRQRNAPINENNGISLTPAKPSSMKRQREHQDGEEASKQSTKKNKKTGKLENKEKKASSLEENDAPEEKNLKSEKKRKKNADTPVDKSGKEKAAWNPKEEVAFLSGLAECSGKGKPLVALLQSRMKSSLNNSYSDQQLYNKLKRLRTKFKDVVEKVKDPGFSFKSAHEETVYKLSKEIWGKGEEEESTPAKRDRNKDGNKKVAAKPDEEEEEERKEHENDKDDDNGSESNAEEDKDLDIEKGDQKIGKDLAARVSNGVQDNMLLHLSKGELNKGGGKVPLSHLNELIKEVLKENMDTMKDFYKELLKENMNAMNNYKNELLAANQNTLNQMIEANQRVSSNMTFSNLQFSTKEMIQRFSSLNSRELHPLTNSEIKGLKRKWKEQEAVEMEVTSKRLALLQEELQMKMTKFRSAGSENSTSS